MSHQNDDNNDDGGLENELNKYYLYQNKHTGEVSSNPLTVRQLCLVLSNTSSAGMITGDTMVIGIDGETKSYSSSGWKAARSIPVLREACSSWHYEDGSGVVKGPVSLRVVQDGLVQNGRVWSPDIAAKPNETNQNNENENKSQNSKKCNDLESRWRTVSEDLNLRVAMKALGRRQQEKKKEEVDPATMIMYEDSNSNSISNSMSNSKDEVEDELGAFLNEHDTSDHALLTSEQHLSSLTSNKRKDIATPLKRKTKKPKFNARNASKWIYVTNVPKDATEHELISHFSRAGIIDLDPLTQQPRIKLYRHPTTTNNTIDGLQGTLKGDASICYARIESVDLAIQILDESLLRATSKTPLRVSKAKFQQKNNNQTTQISNNLTLKQRRIAKIAVHQRLNWDEGENGRLSGGRKGLCIVVFKHVFPPFRNNNNNKSSQNSHQEEDVYFQTMERQIRNQCETQCGPVEKITIFSKNNQGVVIVKFTKTSSATAAIETFHAKDTTFLLTEQTRSTTNTNVNRNKLVVTFWDYVTDYDHQDYHEQQQEEEDRLDQFGSWLDNQDLPDEFKLKVEGDEDS